MPSHGPPLSRPSHSPKPCPHHILQYEVACTLAIVHAAPKIDTLMVYIVGSSNAVGFPSACGFPISSGANYMCMSSFWCMHDLRVGHAYWLRARFSPAEHSLQICPQVTGRDRHRQHRYFRLRFNSRPPRFYALFRHRATWWMAAMYVALPSSK